MNDAARTRSLGRDTIPLKVQLSWCKWSHFEQLFTYVEFCPMWFVVRIVCIILIQYTRTIQYIKGIDTNATFWDTNSSGPAATLVVNENIPILLL